MNICDAKWLKICKAKFITIICRDFNVPLPEIHRSGKQ